MVALIAPQRSRVRSVAARRLPMIGACRAPRRQSTEEERRPGPILAVYSWDMLRALLALLGALAAFGGQATVGSRTVNVSLGEQILAAVSSASFAGAADHPGDAADAPSPLGARRPDRHPGAPPSPSAPCHCCSRRCCPARGCRPAR